MRSRVAALGTLGAAATAVAAGVVLAPDLVLSVEPARALVAAVGGRDPAGVLLLVGAAASGYLAVAARGPGRREPVSEGGDDRARTRFEAAATAPPEAVTARRRRRTARDLDATLAAAVRGSDGDLQRARARLRKTAASAYASGADLPPERAAAAVAEGTWTDDDLAAAFLAEGGRPTPWARIRLWLWPAAERRRRIDRATAAIEACLEERR